MPDRIAQGIASKLYGEEPMSYQQRCESLMDELVKLANAIEGRAQTCRQASSKPANTVIDTYMLEGAFMAYEKALVMLQEVMRNA